LACAPPAASPAAAASAVVPPAPAPIAAARAPASCPSEGPATGLLAAKVPFQEWPVLSAKQVGLLLTVRSPWGVDVGWTRLLRSAEDGRNEDWGNYLFTFGGHSPWALYFASHGEGVHFLKQWRVPLPDKTSWVVDAAMQRPGAGAPWGFSAPAHLVEVEVNGGQGAASNLHFVATKARILDGTSEYPIVSSRALDDARLRFDAWRDACGAAIDEAFSEAARSPSGPPVGPEKETAYEAIAPTWDAGAAELRVPFFRRVVRASERTERKMVVHACPPGAPCLPPREEMVTTRHGYGVEIAYEAAYDREGKLVATHAFGPTKVPLPALEEQGIR
jgi:hypothetical protein